MTIFSKSTKDKNPQHTFYFMTQTDTNIYTWCLTVLLNVIPTCVTFFCQKRTLSLFEKTSSEVDYHETDFLQLV